LDVPLQGVAGPAGSVRDVGSAVAYRRYSMDHVGAENETRKARGGMWRRTFVKP
jgi:hypothetical protein